MPNLVLFHNPRCSKSRQALALLEEKKLSFEVVLYLKDGLSEETVNTVVKGLYNAKAITRAHDLIRLKESEYKESGLNESSQDAEVVQALIKYPKLLERPILLSGTHAAIGRPIENIEQLL